MGTLDFWLTKKLVELGMTQGWAKLLAILAGFFGNYILRRVLVFPDKKRKTTTLPTS